jgi:sigma-B regulation protein RsbU (phosphoserine phosphatase)
VHTPNAVLESLSARDFDLLLMDLNYARDTTSGAEGMDLLERVRQLDSDLPVVVMTAWATVPVAVDAMRRGALDFVEKPWDNAQLVKTLDRQLKRRTVSSSVPAREELRDAINTQRALLPKETPQIPGCDTAVAWVPANGVSGDYMDFIRLGGSRVAVCVGDVAGKGVSAALVMSNLQASIRALAPGAASTAELITRVNRIVSANVMPNRFITLFYGVLDGRRLSYTNAGHWSPLLIRENGECVRLEAGGAVLGVFPDRVTYEQAEIELRAGDRLFLFTDGIVEAESPNGADFGEQRLREFALANRALNASTLRQKLMSTLSNFTGGQFQDDATLVILAVE